MRLTFPLTLVLLLSACGDNGGNETTNTPTGSPTGDSASSTEGTGSTTAPTTGSPGTSTGDPVTTTSDSTSVGTSTTSDSASSSTGPVDPGTTSEPGTTGTSEPGTSTTDDTGPMPGGDCVTDKDCALHNDCCDCFGIKAGEPDPICKKGCDTLTCDLLGIEQAVCRFGVCGTERVNCDDRQVVCNSLPPKCAAGLVPGVTDNGNCWTGQCVPAMSCNFVPDCSACPADSMCVQKISKMQSLPTCEPIPAECDGKVDCECAGGFVCTGDFNACNANGNNEITCGCPVC